MSFKICPNCRKENDKKADKCISCNSQLDIDKFIESKTLKKGFISKVKSKFTTTKEDKINKEIKELILLNQNFHDYETDLKTLQSDLITTEKSNKFKDKFQQIDKLDSFKYLDEIEDTDLKKTIKELKSIQKFFKNYDKEINDFNKIVRKTNGKLDKINEFNEELNKIISTEETISSTEENNIVFKYKNDFDYFDSNDFSKINLNGEKKREIEKLNEKFNDIHNIIEEHNEEVNLRKTKEIAIKSESKIKEFNEIIVKLEKSNEYIENEEKEHIKNQFKETYDKLYQKNLSKINISNDLKTKINNFLNDYSNLDSIIIKINKEISAQLLKEKLNKRLNEVKAFNDELNQLIESEFYITFKQKDKLKEKYEELYNSINQAEKEGIDLELDMIRFLQKYSNLDNSIEDRNEIFVQEELEEHKDLFDNIDGLSLDEKQRLAIVTDELNTQIIAGAGCGKTLTVNGKVRYLIERKGINPSKILCLSYSAASVQDLKKKLPNEIQAFTFHSLGRSILKENGKPSTPDDESLNTFIKHYFKEEVIENETLCAKILDFYAYYFYKPIEEEDASSLGELYDMEAGRDFKTLRELYGGDNKKETLDQKTVKSLEELIISNFFFMHQINYTYEKTYTATNKNYNKQKEFISYLLYENIIIEDADLTECKITEELGLKIMKYFNIKKEEVLEDYHPDFYLDDYDIYLEHFGVNRECDARWLSPKESQKYKEGITWKRELHKEKQTKLLETYSYYMSENRLLKRLEEKLIAEEVDVKEINYDYLLKEISKRDDVNKYKDFMKLITGFIELFKGNNYTVNKFKEFKEQNKTNPHEFDKKRNELFLDIVEDVYVCYENYLKSRMKIDFNDMINHATALVKEGRMQKDYQYIIVDEYQDTSHTRYQLLKAIQNHCSAKVCVVGDDWQSIYRFSGCDVSLFSQFEDYFENPVKLRIETTYRNSQELIDISGDFINKNPKQINKSLKSKKESCEKPVKIAYYNDKNKEDLSKTLEYVVNLISRYSDNILILGRNNFDIKSYLEEESPFSRLSKNSKTIIYEKNKDLNIEYFTVHKSKGLEEDNVILINLENKTSGFPNKKVDDPLLKFVTSDTDDFAFAEERRLFYVALTRTKNNVYLLTPETNKSIFVEELEKDIDKLEIISKEDLNNDNKNIEDTDEFMKDKKIYSLKTKLKCPICQTGDIKLIILNKTDKENLTKFFVCSHDRCEWNTQFYSSDIELLEEIEICPKCNGIIQVLNGRYGPYQKCNNRDCNYSPKMNSEKLKRVNKIIDKMDEKVQFELIETGIKCPQCNNGNVTLAINPKNKNKHLTCSNETCNWKTKKINIQKDDLNKIKKCPQCNSFLIPKTSRSGNKFLGCINYPECRQTAPLKEEIKEPKTIRRIETQLNCPKCGRKIILNTTNQGHERLECLTESCSWEGGYYNGSIEDLDKIKYCPNCDGILFLRDGKYGKFYSCTNYSKTGCKGKSKTTYVKKETNQNTSQKKCPKCGKSLKIRNGEYGKFYGCTGFPQCRYTENI